MNIILEFSLQGQIFPTNFIFEMTFNVPTMLVFCMSRFSQTISGAVFQRGTYIVLGRDI